MCYAPASFDRTLLQLSENTAQTPETAASAAQDILFESLDLDDSLMRGIDALGFEKCSPIQAKILPYTLEGHDAIGKAQTGTGKTAAFLITLFNDLLNNPIEGERYLAEPRAVVLAPTR